MKTYSNLFNKTISLENLLDAWEKFKVGKRNKLDVRMFERNLEDNLFELHNNLASKKYRHGPYSSFYIKDPKIRLIHKSMVRDRVVHHAVFKVLESIFEPSFIFDSYSCRNNKGTHRAVKRLKFFLDKTNYRYKKCFVLKANIKKFFHSIDHDILLNIIKYKVKDSDLLWLIEVFINSFPAVANSRERERERESKGCPIGNLTSQLFANIYLNKLDQFVKHKLKIKYYIRYTDDFVITHHDLQYLYEIKNTINDFLKQRLLLGLHPGKTVFRKYNQGVDFLGYIILPCAVDIRTKTKRRIFRKIDERIGEFKNEIISETSLLQSLNSYWGVLDHANSHKLKNKLLHFIWSSLKSP